MAKCKLAFVLGGGGARGALQVGALRALLEAGHSPNLVVGTSIGALNAAFLGLHGFNSAGLAALEDTWRDAAAADLLPSRYVWLTVRTFFGRGGVHREEQMRAFLAGHGIAPDLRFGDLRGVPARLVAADLNGFRPAIIGAAANDLVQDGVLASAALPPWMHPLERSGRLLLDGGMVSNVPIEPALNAGATEIVALDISEPNAPPSDEFGFGAWLNKLSNTLLMRQFELELALAEARKVRVRRLWLRFEHIVALWDFSHTDELMAAGYALAKAEIADWRPARGFFGLVGRAR
jgi:NTE family protein